MDTGIQQFLQWVHERSAPVRRIAVLTGAGISAESGIPTFRGDAGLWRGEDPTAYFFPDALRTDPQRTWSLYDELRVLMAKSVPNDGHAALAVLGRHCDVTLITQNIDGLHQRAGSAPVNELHGSMWRLRCTACRHQEDNHHVPLPVLPPVCRHCNSLLRPDIVLYTEPLSESILERAIDGVETCELMLVIGTSGVVYPAASLPHLARDRGAVLVEVNVQETPLTRSMDFAIHAPAAQALPQLVDVLINGI